MAIRATDVGGPFSPVVEKMCAKKGEATDVFRTDVIPWIQGRVASRGILATEAVPRRIVGNQRRFVELDGDPEKEGKIVLDERVLIGAAIADLAFAIVLRH